MLVPAVGVRTATESDLPVVARIHMASWQDAYKGILPDALLAGRTTNGALAGWRKTFTDYPGNITVACAADGAVIGFCCAGPVVDAGKNAPFQFQVYGLHADPPHRRQGAGAALLRAGLDRSLHEFGMTSAIVWTLEDLTMSRKFYEREGGTIAKTGTWNAGGFAIAEVAYGWPDLAFLPRRE